MLPCTAHHPLLSAQHVISPLFSIKPASSHLHDTDQSPPSPAAHNLHNHHPLATSPPAQTQPTSTPVQTKPTPTPVQTKPSPSPVPNNAVNENNGGGLSNATIESLAPPLGFKSGVNPTGTGDCDGAIDGADGKPIKIPCDCPPAQDVYISVRSTLQACIPRLILF